MCHSHRHIRHSTLQQQACAARRAVLNDSYRTDVSLVHAPYVVAIGCMVVAAALTERNLLPWLEGLACDMDQVGAPQGPRLMGVLAMSGHGVHSDVGGSAADEKTPCQCMRHSTLSYDCLFQLIAGAALRLPATDKVCASAYSLPSYGSV